MKAVLCDLDGTLVDSAEDIRAALNELLAELRLDAVGPNEIRGMIGDGVGMLIERALAARGGDPADAAHLVPAVSRRLRAQRGALDPAVPRRAGNLEGLEGPRPARGRRHQQARGPRRARSSRASVLLRSSR
jgi:phosphoglycolate phosphatase-like HAD superfamily hydrolase